ncbi:adenylosuccinate lyase [Candidatus Shapirobacteria bacterium]|nr:adenylosuccinate lyase [Candidatus Shapirobacteria bacterium]
MSLSELTAISPIDGRYRKNVIALGDYFSEFAYMRYRILIEVEYTIALLNILKRRKLTLNDKKRWRAIYQKFNSEDAFKISAADSTWDTTKQKVTRHDFKSIQYYLNDKLHKLGYGVYVPFVHFGLTTYDITIPAYGLALKESRDKIIYPAVLNLLLVLKQKAKIWANILLLGRTHGQPAVPTTIGKEIKNFEARVEKVLEQIREFRFEAKLDGAVGNFNALVAAYSEIDWIKFSDKFLLALGLTPNHVTTQILPYDNWLQYFSALKLLNNVLIGFCQDVWRYISDDYLVQIPKSDETGSSTMPQKVNPIDFENAEGNLGVANSLFEFYERKLPISRLQRDLSDSTVKRTFGVALAHSLFAYQNIISGLGKITPNEKKINQELEGHWEIITEGIQTILRTEGVVDAYEKLKKLTRGKKVTKGILDRFVNNLSVDPRTKGVLRKLSPLNYIGLAKKIAMENTNAH